MLRRITGAVTAAFVGLALAGTASSVASTDVTRASAAGRGSCQALRAHGVPACGVLWGVSVPGGSARQLAVDEKQVGRRFDLSYHFHRIGDALPNRDERKELRRGHLLHVNLEPIRETYAEVSAGRSDAALVRQARGIAKIRRPVYVTFAHEPDAKASAGLGTDSQFVAAWRHVHRLFARHGASNAAWVWVVTGWKGNFARYAGLYPGNRFVDWVSWDPYSTASCAGTGRVPLAGTFSTATGPMYDWLHDGHGAAAGIDPAKPEMLSEYGAAYDSGAPAAQGAWYRHIPHQLASSYPAIRAVALWDDRIGHCDYKKTASRPTLAGFREAGRSTYVDRR